MVLTEQSKNIIQEHLPGKRSLKNVTNFFSVFADATRFQIITALLMSSMSVNDLASVLAMNQSTVSHQLKTLRAADVVETTRMGKVVIYNVVDGIDKVLEHGFSRSRNQETA